MVTRNLVIIPNMWLHIYMLTDIVEVDILVCLCVIKRS